MKKIPTFITLKRSIILTGLMLLYASQNIIAQDTITIGTMNSVKGVSPFGIDPYGQAYYIGEYQQVYSSNAFSGSVLITQVAFSTSAAYSSTASYSLSVGLGVTTTKTPVSPGNEFTTDTTTVFSGSLSPVFTTTANDFDFIITFTTPYNYNPIQGNLLLDIVLSSATSDSNTADSEAVFYNLDANSLNMGALWGNDNSVVIRPNYGLATQFTVVPEPSVISLAVLAGGALFYVRKRNPIELYTPTIGRTMPTKKRLVKIRRWTGFSADEPGESSAYLKLNRPTPCPPRSAVPVNP